MPQLIIKNSNELPGTAFWILKHCAGKKVFAFLGDLGSGKTTIIKALCSQLGVQGHAVSPTFAIVNEYRGKFPVYHIDLYRLNDTNEAIGIGIEEYLASGNYCFIEWPQIIENILPEQTVRVNIDVKENHERHLTITGC